MNFNLLSNEQRRKNEISSANKELNLFTLSGLQRFKRQFLESFRAIEYTDSPEEIIKRKAAIREFVQKLADLKDAEAKKDISKLRDFALPQNIKSKDDIVNFF